MLLWAFWRNPRNFYGVLRLFPCVSRGFCGIVVGSLQVEHASHPVDRRRRLFASFEVNGFVRRFRRTLVCASACVTAGAFLVPATDSIHGETHRAQELVISEPRINDRIRVPEVRLVGPGGEQVGVVPLKDALRLAEDAELDLVEVAPNAKPPVCKLMDYGKYKYEAAIKARESRKKQANAVLKEIRFRLKIDTHDYETKVGHARRFLSGGDKVKAMIQFRGREQQRPEMGVRLLERLAAELAEVSTVESRPRQDGRNMVMVLAPLRGKAEARREQGAGGRKGRERIDTTKAKPVTNSLADAMPAELKAQASAE